MKHLFLFVLISICIHSYGQITKDNWLLGGTGSLRSLKTSYSSPNLSTTSKRLDITVSPGVGYFVKDRLALGLKAGYSKYKEQVDGPGGGYTNTNRYSFGPFVRYYFLLKEKEYNILTESSYQYGLYSFRPTKGHSYVFTALAGPVIYFNSSVGLEFLIGYYNTKETIRINDNDFVTRQKGIQVSIGFQFHLEK